MKSKEIYLLRHGDTGMGERYIGATNVSLSAFGREQIINIGTVLTRKTYDMVFCSPLQRCQESYALLNMPQASTMDDRLREINFGVWEGLTFAEIAAENNHLVNQWQDTPQTFRFPEGESLAEFQARVLDFHTLLRAVDKENILIISHGGVIRHLICLLLGLSLDKYLLFSVATGSLASVRLFSEGAVLTGFNIQG